MRFSDANNAISGASRVRAARGACEYSYMPPPPGPDRDVIDSRFNRVLAVAIWVISGVLAVSLCFTSRPTQLAYLVPLALICLVVWESLWRPRLVIANDEITVVNPGRDVRIPWNALVHVDTKFALTLYTPGQKYEVWIAPSPGRSFGYRSAAAASRDVRQIAPHRTNSVRPGDLASSESGAAAALVRGRWHRLQEAGVIETGVADSTRVDIRWHWTAIVPLVVLFAASVPALLIA